MMRAKRDRCRTRVTFFEPRYLVFICCRSGGGDGRQVRMNRAPLPSRDLSHDLHVWKGFKCIRLGKVPLPRRGLPQPLSLTLPNQIWFVSEDRRRAVFWNSHLMGQSDFVGAHPAARHFGRNALFHPLLLSRCRSDTRLYLLSFL